MLRIGRSKSSSANQKKFLEGDNKDLLAILQLAILGGVGLVLLIQLVLMFLVNNIVNRRPTFVQLTNGQAIYVAERERNYRNPEMIRNTVKQWLFLTFNWEGVIPGTQTLDQGIAVVGTSRKVPFSTSIASYLVEPAFAQAMLKQIAEQIVPDELFAGNARQLMTISYLSDPRQIADGRWQVDVVSTRNLIDKRTGASVGIAFNKTFTLRAIEIPQSPLEDQASLVEKLVYSTMASGLQITDIQPYNPSSPTGSGVPVPSPTDKSTSPRITP